MRIGIVGAGSIGEKHAEAAAAVGVEVAWIVDRDEDRAAEAAANHGARSSSDPGSIWDDDTVDAAIIAVPNCFHRPLALDALRAGKDVFLEKPMGLNVAECDEILDAVEEHGRVLQLGFTHRFSPVGDGAKRLIDAGEVGEPYQVRAHLLLRRGIPGLGGWFTTKAMSGGGALIDLGVHLIDLGLHLLGQPTAVAVSGKTYSKFGGRMRDYVHEAMWAGPPNFDGVFDVEDSATALVTFDTGATLDLQVAWACNLPESAAPNSTFAVLGDRGGVSFELYSDSLRLRNEVAGFNADAKIAVPEYDGMARQMLDFVEAVETRQPGLGATGADGRKVQAIVDAIYASSRTNAPVTL